MVRFKFRYFVTQFEWEDGKTGGGLDGKTLIRTLRSHVSSLAGPVGRGMCDRMAVSFLHPATSIAIIRAPFAAADIVRQVVLATTSLSTGRGSGGGRGRGGGGGGGRGGGGGKRACTPVILHTSGTIAKAKRAIIKRNRRLNMLVARQANGGEGRIQRQEGGEEGVGEEEDMEVSGEERV